MHVCVYEKLQWMTRTNLSHLLLALGLSGLCVGIVVGLDEHQVVGLGVDDELAWGVLQREGHLVENGAQFLQSQNPAGGQRLRVNNVVLKCAG